MKYNFSCFLDRDSGKYEMKNENKHPKNIKFRNYSCIEYYESFSIRINFSNNELREKRYWDSFFGMQNRNVK